MSWSFFAYLSRLKLIRRWALMRNTQPENDAEHSLQVAMIAQGDFEKLLVAKTDERREIFRTLFKTDNFARLQDDLKETR